MKKLIVFIITLLAVSLTACGKTDTAVIASSLIYYVDINETKVVSEPYEPVGTTKEELIDEYIDALDLAPANQAYKKAKPDDVVITDYEFGADGQLILYFNEAYNTMSGISEILCRAVIVKTLCQIDDIEYIEFYVNGQSLLLSGETPVGIMKAEDFIDNTGGVANYNQFTYISIFYANETGDALLEANLQVEYEGSRTKEQLIMEQLVNGPIPELTGMIDTLPEGTVVNSVSTKDGVCYVDFNDAFLEKRIEVTEEVTIYSVVNSLVELGGIYKVQITINGEQRKVYQSIDISGMLERNLDLLQEE